MSIDHGQIISSGEDDQHNSGSVLPEVDQNTFNSLLPNSVRTKETEGLPVELLPAGIAETPALTETKPSRFTRAQKIAAAAVGAALTIGASVAVYENENQKHETKATEVSQPVVAPPVAPSPEASVETPASDPTNVPPAVEQAPSTLVNPAVLPVSVVELGSFNTLTPEKKQYIRSMELMSVEACRALPDSDQLMFAQFVYDNNIGILRYRLDKTNQSKVYKDVLNATPSTPQAIEAQEKLTLALMSSLDTRDSNSGAMAFDSVTARKLTVLITNNLDALGLQRTQRLDETIATWNINTPPVISDDRIEASFVGTGKTILNTYSKKTDTHAQTTYGEPTIINTIDNRVVTTSRQTLSIPTDDPRYIQLPK